jgi:hypothetical protein
LLLFKNYPYVKDDESNTSTFLSNKNKEKMSRQNKLLNSSKQMKGSKIDKVLFLKYDQFYRYNFDYNDLTLTLESKQNKKTILMFVNENTNIALSKFSTISLEFHNAESLKNIEKVLTNKD